MDEPMPPVPPGPTVKPATPLDLVTQAIRLLHSGKTQLEPKPGQGMVKDVIHFFRHFRDKPFKNTLIVLGWAALVGFFVVLFIFASRADQEKQRLRRESLSYVAQTQALDNVKRSLDSLLEFVQGQKDKLQESEDIVNRLQAEQEKLKPVVETNRQVIDAILDLQAQKAKSDVWQERAIGFVSGIVTSIIASAVFAFFARRKRTEELSENEKAPPGASV